MLIISFLLNFFFFFFFTPSYYLLMYLWDFNVHYFSQILGQWGVVFFFLKKLTLIQQGHIKLITVFTILYISLYIYMSFHDIYI